MNSGGDYDPESTLKSLAFMLGWSNVPPREVLERSLNELRNKLTRKKQQESERALAAIVESQKFQMERNQAREERDEIRAELKGWMTTYPPSLCSAHRQVNLNCRMCNPAIRQRDALVRLVQTRLIHCCNSGEPCEDCLREQKALLELGP